MAGGAVYISSIQPPAYVLSLQTYEDTSSLEGMWVRNSTAMLIWHLGIPLVAGGGPLVAGVGPLVAGGVPLVAGGGPLVAEHRLQRPQLASHVPGPRKLTFEQSP